MAGCDSSIRRIIKALEKRNLEEAKKLLRQSVERASNEWVEGYPVLCYALQQKNRDFAKLLLDNNARVNGNCYKYEGWPLYFSVTNGDLEMTKLLLEKGANPNNSNKEMKTALFYAIEANNIEIVELLLENKAHVDTRNKSNDTPLSVAIVKGYFEITEKLIKYKANVNLKVDTGRYGTKQSPLHYAICFKQLKIVDLLLKNGASMNVQDKYKKTPFQEAVEYGNLEIIKCFIKHGANVNEIFNEDKENCSPLYTALCNTSQEVVELLIKAGANVNGGIKDSEIPLHAAVIKGNLKIVKSLLELGAKVNFPSNSTKKKGYTALHYAAEKLVKKSFDMSYSESDDSSSDESMSNDPPSRFLLPHVSPSVSSQPNDSSSGDVSLVQFLISKGANVNAKDAVGKTPLHCAIKKCNLKIIKCLLKHGADLNAMYGSHYGYMPLHYACEVCDDSSHEVVNLLLNNGANINARAKNNYLPIHVAIKNERVQVADLLFQKGVSPDTPFNKRKTLLFVALRNDHSCLKIIKTILKYKPNLQDKGNINAFLLAVKTYGNDKLVQLLLEYGFRMRPKDIRNHEFIHAAFTSGYTAIVNDILQYSTDINRKYDLKSNKGFTLLHSAVSCKNIEAIKSLLKHGVDLSVKDSNGKTAIFYAVRNLNLTIVEQLLIAMNKSLLPILPDLLSEAIRSRYKEMIELLVQYSDNLNALDEDGYPPLYYTTLNLRNEWNRKVHYYLQNIENDKIAKFLLSKGANPNILTKEGKSILYHATVNERSSVVEDLLLQNANPNLSNNNLFIPLHSAVKFQHSNLVELLLKHKANVNAANSFGRTALHLASAVKQDISRNVELLLKYKAEINCVDLDGMTPLHIAAKLDNAKVVKILLQNKASVNAKSLNGKTPLHLASERGSHSCVRDLLRFGANVNIKDMLNCTPLGHALESARSQEERGEIQDNDFFHEDNSNSEESDEDDSDEECFDPGYTIDAADDVVETLKNYIQSRVTKQKYVSKTNLKLMNCTVPRRDRFKRSRNSFWF